MGVDVERRELDRPVEVGVPPERATDIHADHQRRAGRRGPFRGRTRHHAERYDQCRDASGHGPPPSTVWVLPVAKIGVLWSTWSSDRNGSVKCGLPLITTTRQLKPAAISWTTGSGSSSPRGCPSFLNHSGSALKALHGPPQKPRPPPGLG